MKQYQKQFIDFAIARKALGFGEFTLKSGRVSPYFFNAGLFNDGQSLLALGQFYAEAIMDSGVDFDMLFGPAYKGIPLATVTAVELARKFDLNIPVAYNRKEAKDHGEGGSLVGAPLSGKVLVIDDVITAGTAIREAIGMIGGAGATSCGVAIALDRQEKGQSGLSAIQELEQNHNLEVISIVDLSTLVARLQEQEGQDREFASILPKIRQYREQYGI